MLDLDAHSLALKSQAFEGRPIDLALEDVLDNVTFYWVTNTAISSARLY